MYYQCKNLEQNCWLHRNRYVPLMGNGTLLITEAITGNNMQKCTILGGGGREEGGGGKKGQGRGNIFVVVVAFLVVFS